MGLLTASVLLRVERLSDSASLKIENKEERRAFYRTSVAVCRASACLCKFEDRKRGRALDFLQRQCCCVWSFCLILQV